MIARTDGAADGDLDPGVRPGLDGCSRPGDVEDADGEAEICGELEATERQSTAHGEVEGNAKEIRLPQRDAAARG